MRRQTRNEIRKQILLPFLYPCKQVVDFNARQNAQEKKKSVYPYNTKGSRLGPWDVKENQIDKNENVKQVKESKLKSGTQ